jgi:hypothetical protein
VIETAVLLVVLARVLAAAQFLILELDTPYGAIRISDAPVRILVEQLGRQRS